MYDLETLGKIENTAELFSSGQKPTNSYNNKYIHIIYLRVENPSSQFQEKQNSTPSKENNISTRNNIPSTTRKKSGEVSPNKNKLNIIKSNMNISGVKHNISRDNFTVYSKVELFDPGMTKMASGE